MMMDFCFSVWHTYKLSFDGIKSYIRTIGIRISLNAKELILNGLQDVINMI